MKKLLAIVVLGLCLVCNTVFADELGNDETKVDWNLKCTATNSQMEDQYIGFKEYQHPKGKILLRLSRDTETAKYSLGGAVLKFPLPNDKVSESVYTWFVPVRDKDGNIRNLINYLMYQYRNGTLALVPIIYDIDKKNGSKFAKQQEQIYKKMNDNDYVFEHNKFTNDLFDFIEGKKPSIKMPPLKCNTL